MAKKKNALSSIKKLNNANQSLPKLTKNQTTRLKNKLIKENKKLTEYQIKNRRAQKLGFKTYDEYLKYRKKAEVQNPKKVKAGKAKAVEVSQKGITKSGSSVSLHFKIGTAVILNKIADKVYKTINEYENKGYNFVDAGAYIEWTAEDVNGVQTKQSNWITFESEQELYLFILNPIEYDMYIAGELGSGINVIKIITDYITVDMSKNSSASIAPNINKFKTI